MTALRATVVTTLIAVTHSVHAAQQPVFRTRSDAVIVDVSVWDRSRPVAGLMAADFEVSTAALDLAAEAARRAGALGSRLTGAGFGGSTISLVPTMQVEEVQAVVADAFAEAGLEAPSFLPVVPSAGASRLL